jgi:hypothetical protein
MEQRVQALVTLSRRAVMGFALELGVHVRSFDNLVLKGRGFSRAVSAAKSMTALAAEGT